MRNFSVSQLNPYREIPETIFKKRAVTQGISRKLFPDFAISGRDSGDFPETISPESLPIWVNYYCWKHCISEIYTRYLTKILYL